MKKTNSIVLLLPIFSVILLGCVLFINNTGSVSGDEYCTWCDYATHTCCNDLYFNCGGSDDCNSTPSCDDDDCQCGSTDKVCNSCVAGKCENNRDGIGDCEMDDSTACTQAYCTADDRCDYNGDPDEPCDITTDTLAECTCLGSFNGHCVSGQCMSGPGDGEECCTLSPNACEEKNGFCVDGECDFLATSGTPCQDNSSCNHCGTGAQCEKGPPKGLEIRCFPNDNCDYMGFCEDGVCEDVDDGTHACTLGTNAECTYGCENGMCVSGGTGPSCDNPGEACPARCGSDGSCDSVNDGIICSGELDCNHCEDGVCVEGVPDDGQTACSDPSYCGSTGNGCYNGWCIEVEFGGNPNSPCDIEGGNAQCAACAGEDNDVCTADAPSGPDHPSCDVDIAGGMNDPCSKSTCHTTKTGAGHCRPGVEGAPCDAEEDCYVCNPLGGCTFKLNPDFNVDPPCTDTCCECGSCTD